jgi:SpoVK/Ycf46/Vps4 family AAA+-type ATPase
LSVRYVGGSEEKIRELFKDAEREQAEVRAEA